MTARTHRCRRSCSASVRNDHAFCPACWRRVPRPVQKLVYRSWAKVQEDRNALYDHQELLQLVEDGLEGDREWESVSAEAARL